MVARRVQGRREAVSVQAQLRTRVGFVSTEFDLPRIDLEAKVDYSSLARIHA